MAAVADQRADLDLQISLLAEHEVTAIAKITNEGSNFGTKGNQPKLIAIHKPKATRCT